MGKRSVRENKNIYQLSREETQLTRERASEAMEYISADRIEKIESGRSLPHPDEVLAMAQCYHRPSLSNYYCSHECPIGERYVPAVIDRPLAEIVLEMLSLLKMLDRMRDRFIDITSNGKIDDDQYQDFAAIQMKLERLSVTVDELRFWLDKMILEGQVDEEKLREFTISPEQI